MAAKKEVKEILVKNIYPGIVYTDAGIFEPEEIKKVAGELAKELLELKEIVEVKVG